MTEETTAAEESKPEIKLDEWNDTASSNIERVRYDTAASELHVIFRRKTPELDGRTFYVYKGVPRGTFDALMKAPSLGRFFGAEIKQKFKWDKRKEVVRMDNDQANKAGEPAKGE